MAEVKDPKPLSKIMSGIFNNNKGFSDFSKRFSSRSPASELMNKGIIKGNSEGVDPQFQSPIMLQQKIALEDAKKKDVLNRRLSLRPTAGDLTMRNILKGVVYTDYRA
jgi:hypothetical protein